MTRLLKIPQKSRKISNISMIYQEQMCVGTVVKQLQMPHDFLEDSVNFWIQAIQNSRIQKN